MNGNVKWHLYTSRAVEEELNTNASCGLSRKEARSRYRKLGANSLFDEASSNLRSQYRAILFDPALLLLLFLCLLTLFFYDAFLGISVLFCLIICAVFVIRVFVLKKKTAADAAVYRVPTVTVLRDGRLYTTSARNIVLGDVIFLHAGDIIPCDCRLIEANALRVLTLYYGENQRAAYAELPKRADLVYPYGSEIKAPFAENMLYGGSELLSGTATVIAVETGASTFLGGRSDFSIPSDRRPEKISDMAGCARPYVRIYSFFLFVLFLPLALIGLLTSNGETGVLPLFLSLSALLGGSSGALLMLYLQTPSVFLRRQCFEEKDRKNFVIKSDRTIARAAEITDLIVLGSCGISDGKLHLSCAFTGEGEVPLGRNVLSAAALCEVFQIHHVALLARNRRLPPSDTLKTVREELVQLCNYDIDALRMRLLQASFLTSTEQKDQVVNVAVRDAEYKLLFTDRSDWIKRCTFYDQNGKDVFWEHEARENVIRKIDAAGLEGGQMQIVIKQTSHNLCFVGAVALREATQENLDTVIRDLQDCGVRVSFFFKNDVSKNQRYAKQISLLHPFLSRQTIGENADLLKYYGKYRVFLGFSDSEIENAIVSLRKSGCKIAVLGNRREQLPILRKASLMISCDPLSYHHRTMKEGLHELMEEDGLEYSARTSQAIRRRADVLIDRAEALQGGLTSVLQLIRSCRDQSLRAYSFFRYLLAAQIPILSVIAFAIVFGRGLINGAQLLYCGALTEIAGLLYLLRLPIKKNRLQKPTPVQKNIEEATFVDKRLWLPPTLASVITAIYALLLTAFGVISGSSCAAFLFLSVLFIQLLSLFFEAHRAGFVSSRLKILLHVLILLVPVLLAILLSCAFAGLNKLLLMGGWPLSLLLSLPVAPAVHCLAFWIISKRFSRTAK